MIIVLTYISLICGGLLVLLLLLGILGGLDLDVDLDFDGDTGAETGGGVGIVKAGLAFLSVAAWTMKMLLATSTLPIIAVLSGVAAGAVAVYVMTRAVHWMLGQEENVNWTFRDALYQPGQVYLRIPAAGEGIVKVNVKGGMRELKARSTDGHELPTGTPIVVDDLSTDNVVLVSSAITD